MTDQQDAPEAPESDSSELYPEPVKRDGPNVLFITIAFWASVFMFYANLSNRPGCKQIAIMVVYTCVIPYMLSDRFLRFAPWALLYRIRQRLLLVHCLALAVVYGITTLSFAVKPKLPYWSVSGRKGSLFEYCLGGILLALAYWECSWISGQKQ